MTATRASKRRAGRARVSPPSGWVNACAAVRMVSAARAAGGRRRAAR